MFTENENLHLNVIKYRRYKNTQMNMIPTMNKLK